MPIIIIGIFNISTLPFSPTWQTASLFRIQPTIHLSLLFNILFFACFLVLQSFLLAGFIRHLIRYPVSPGEDIVTHVERWVWVLFPVGLVIILSTHLLAGWFLLPDLGGLPISAWIVGPLTLMISGMIIYGSIRITRYSSYSLRLVKSPFLTRIFTNEWLYNLVWNLYRSVSRLSALISTVLEGEGGILWALVLFALIFVFLQR